MSTRHVQIELRPGIPVDVVMTRRANNKRMTMRMNASAKRLLVSIPQITSWREGLAFVNSHRDWIERCLAALPDNAPFLEGASIMFRGRPTILIRKDGRGAPRFLDGQSPILEIASSPKRFEAGTRLALKAFAQSEALAYCDQLTPRLGKAPTSIALRDTRSRWGSCTARGDIMLSWRLICAPPKVFEYVVAHELAHLLELNHSPRFWAHVAILMPDWKSARMWLKAHGAQLHALGRATPVLA